MSMEQVVRDTPPSRTKYDWTAIAAKAKQDPMEWYKVFADDKFSLVVSARTSVQAVARDKGFETRSHHTHYDEHGTRRCALWIRYNPDKDRSND